MIREPMWVERADGTTLSRSRKDPGGYSPLARGDSSRRLETQAVLHPFEDHERVATESGSSNGVDAWRSAALVATGIIVGAALTVAIVPDLRRKAVSRVRSTAESARRHLVGSRPKTEVGDRREDAIGLPAPLRAGPRPPA